MQFTKPRARVSVSRLPTRFFVELLREPFRGYGIVPSQERLHDRVGVSVSAVQRAVDLLTVDLDRCSDAALTPLVPVDNLLVPMSLSIVYTSPERNMLARVQSDPGLFGEAGRILGVAGERETLKVLSRLGGHPLIAQRIGVTRRDGSPAGDFDIVVCDPSANLVVVLEIKWGISTDGNADVYKVERGAIEKRAQVIRLRKEVVSGKAKPKWPSAWPDVTGCEFRWYVLTRDVLATRSISDDYITTRSVQLLARTLRKDATVEDLVAALDHPPTPPSALCETQGDRVRYGDISVEIELIVA